ncbi:F0F1 ATP synthase subunit B [Desulfosoma caldarium]|uniref:ATP synthase subunit b n=1 Tax=Desulfosoma caldarium TaxID=610254 RepID=A0A3N1UW17_9BACT|nr:F0F1 ATP synthase subunit B [Desulfosoma caldarium]ROQ92111.1 ATP synthase F0 subcomplex B subunit [Desulfosoma caldarium]
MVRAWTRWWGLTVIAVVWAEQAYAASSTIFGIDRALWDLSWRWINFGILVFFLMKYLKGPLVNFVKERRDAIAGVFDQLKEKEESLDRRRREQEELLAQLDEKIESIKAYYHEIGQEEKEKILAQAERLRRQILEEAQQTAAREFEEAKKKFRAEVVEKAVALAEERIRKKITKKDQRALVNNYLTQLEALQRTPESAGP